MSSSPTRDVQLRPYRRLIRSVVVMVPDTDWAAVLAGSKTMFRSYSQRKPLALMPTPALAYHFGPGERLETTVIWIEETWQEPLGVVSQEDLRDEGFTTLSEFRRYFEARYPKGGYRPLATVQVYRVRPITDGDLSEFSDRLLGHLGYV